LRCDGPEETSRHEGHEIRTILARVCRELDAHAARRGLVPAVVGASISLGAGCGGAAVTGQQQGGDPDAGASADAKTDRDAAGTGDAAGEMGVVYMAPVDATAEDVGPQPPYMGVWDAGKDAGPQPHYMAAFDAGSEDVGPQPPYMGVWDAGSQDAGPQPDYMGVFDAGSKDDGPVPPYMAPPP
jgi:hypothetical protein